MNLISKQILIVIDACASQAQKNFFIQLKNYLNERNQNHVHLLEITADSGSNKLIGILSQRDIDVLVLNVRLPDEIIRRIKNSANITAGINFAGNELFDFNLNICEFNDVNLVECAMKISVVDKLNWDTGFFNINIARLNHSKLSDNLIDFTLKICRQNNIECLYYTADSDHPMSVRLAEKHNFHFSNIRVKYVLNSENEYLHHSSNQQDSFLFRECKVTDYDRLIEMSKNLYRDSRYYFDSNFSDEVCDKLYTEWVRKIATSQRKEDKVYVLAKDNNEATGYIAGGVEFDTVHIFLVGVDIFYRGQDIGKILVSNFIKKYKQAGYSKFEVVTQGRNIPAQRIYQACGFKIGSSEIDYHKWF